MLLSITIEINVRHVHSDVIIRAALLEQQFRQLKRLQISTAIQVDDIEHCLGPLVLCFHHHTFLERWLTVHKKMIINAACTSKSVLDCTAQWWDVYVGN